MSKILKWQYSDFLESRRDKLVNLLLSEITFLKSQIKHSNNTDIQVCMETALIKLEYLLNNLKDRDHDLDDEEFDKLILLVYNIFKEIARKIEE